MIRTSSMPRSFLVAAVALGLASSAPRARADAVPPPPKDCPEGTVGITSHGGPECAKAPPEDCPPGYRGVVGGKCKLAFCSSDTQCNEGSRCQAVDTCQEFREHHWTGWGWKARQPIPRTNLLAEPPSPPPPGPAKRAWVSLSICGQDGPCKAPGECRPASLCIPVGASPNASPNASPGPTTGAPDRASGCRKGCAVSPVTTLAGAAGLGVLVIVTLLRRRKRAPHAHRHER